MAAQKVEIELPSDLLLTLDIPESELGRRAQEWVVLELFREGEISAGKGAEILGLSRCGFVDLLNLRNLPYLDADADQLRREVEAAEAAVSRTQQAISHPLIQANRQEILALAERRGVRNVRLFGSIARGEACAASDVNFLVELAPGRTLLDLGSFQMDLQDLLGRKSHVVEPAGLRWFIRDRVLAEAIPL